MALCEMYEGVLVCRVLRAEGLRDGIVRDVQGREGSQLPDHGRHLLQLVVREVQLLQ